MKRPAGMLLLSAALGAGVVCPLSAQTAEQPARRPKVGIALGGGGARGFAHIGALRALEAMHIPIDYIAGTSMGSVVGSLYALGYSPDQMEQVVAKIHWDTVFDDTREIVAQLPLQSMLDRDQPSQAPVTTASSSAARAARAGRPPRRFISRISTAHE